MPRIDQSSEKQSGQRTPVIPVIPAGGDGHIPPFAPGGYGDDWDKNPPGKRGPREQLHLYRLALAVALLSIFTLFSGLIATYISRRSGGHMDPVTGRWIHDWQPLVLPKLLWVNTAMLMASSAFIEMARRKLYCEADVMAEWFGYGSITRKRSLPWILLSLVFGLAFLAGQFLVWRKLQLQGVHIYGDPSGSYFYILTGTHALHLLGGVFALIWCSAATVRGAKLQSRQILVDVTAWYWHAMGALWVAIFLLLWFVRT